MDNHKEDLSSTCNPSEMCVSIEEDPLRIVDELSTDIKAINNCITKCENKELDLVVEGGEAKSLPPKRSRKSSRKKVESLQSTSQIYQCVRCPQAFSRLSQLKSHAKSHSEEKSEKFECTVCDLVLDNMKSLITHRRHHVHRTFKCNICKTEYNHHTSFKIHMRLHKGEKPYVCKECGASFSQSGHLSIHKRTHTGEKPYTCDICSNNFKQISHLKTHVRTHTHDKPYRCNQCSAAFTQNSSLKRHKRVHTGEKPYKCAYCGMNFVVKSNMQRHLNTHTGERPFQCDLCPASFGQAIDLKRHKISHTGVKPFKCDLCDAAFSRKNNLKWHKLTHSENAGFHCNICYVGFSSTGDLKAHMRNHAPPKPYSCDVCPASFRLIESLDRHKMIHTGERPLRLKTSKQNVSKEAKKPFNCLLCSASFCEKRNLKRHAFSVHHNLSTFRNNNLDYEKPEVEIDVPQTEASQSVMHEAQEQLTEEHLEEPTMTHQPCFQTDGSIPSMQQIVMQTIPTQEGFTHVPQFLLTGPGHTPRPARPAGHCQNHSLHILTFVEGSYNHWQSWCFCDPPNIPDTTTQIIVPPSTNDATTENMTQILVTAPIQSSVPDSTTQLLMTVPSPTVAETNHQIIFSPASLNHQTISTTTNIGSLSLGAQPVDIQGTLLTSSNSAFIKEVKSESKEWM